MHIAEPDKLGKVFKCLQNLMRRTVGLFQGGQEGSMHCPPTPQLTGLCTQLENLKLIYPPLARISLVFLA